MNGNIEIYRITIIASVAVITVAVIVSLLFNSGNPDVERLSLVIGLVAPTITGLLALLRTDTANNKVDKVKDAVNGHLSQHTILLREHLRLMGSQGMVSRVKPESPITRPPQDPQGHA